MGSAMMAAVDVDTAAASAAPSLATRGASNARGAVKVCQLRRRMNVQRVQPDGAGHVRLNEWVHPGRITDVETDRREQYGYDASWTVVAAIETEVGLDGMKRVFAAAQAHQIAYVGALTPETVDGGNDWRPSTSETLRGRRTRISSGSARDGSSRSTSAAR